MSQNSDMFWKPTIAIEADVATALVKISDGLKGGVKCAEEWLPSLQKRDDEKEDANRFTKLSLPSVHAELIEHNNYRIRSVYTF